MKKKTKKEENEKEEDKKHVTEGSQSCQTWLADAIVAAHFESLNMEANDNVALEINEDDMLKDSEDGNEVPLGKMLQRLKAKGAKERSSVKIGSIPPAAQNNNNNNDNNVDMSGMVREITLNNSSMSNGHEKAKFDEKRKRKRIPNQSISVSVSKHQKTKGLSAFDNIKMSISENNPDLGDHIETEHGNTDGSDFEKPKKFIGNDGNNHRSGSVRKRKRKSVAGLVKSMSKERESHTTDLIGRRIKVWWPMDKAFYEGLVKSYDHQKKRHVVLYNDGDVEVLHLDKERWELISNTPKPTKRNKLSKSPHPKKGSSKKKIKDINNNKKNKESSDIYSSPTVRGKRTPRKNRQRQKKLEYIEVERKEDPDDMTDSEYELDGATFSKVDNLDSEEEDAENRFRDHESWKEIKPDSGQNESGDSGSDQEDKKQSPSLTTNKSNEDDAELSDDMPIGVWKSKVKETR